MKEIAVDGLTIDHSAGSGISGGSFSIISQPSSTVKLTGKGVFFGDIQFSFSGGNMTGMAPGSVSGSGSISPTGTKVKSGGFCAREGDSGTMSGTAQPVGSPPPTPVPVSGGVEITDAGQTKGLSN